ncbi:hypothetical protein PMPD1_1289 [Paramixta manurensis]|uniref:Uncharacterized protein n=1 Tax=Paramixta manurensis TaxID=2740817 RepID=A0A6M8UHH1_9GAMM|nr:hypothetical protein PMPD1_1289 [Erwiniaceae bacterium PD-1]
MWLLPHIPSLTFQRGDYHIIVKLAIVMLLLFAIPFSDKSESCTYSYFNHLRIPGLE